MRKALRISMTLILCIILISSTMIATAAEANNSTSPVNSTDSKNSEAQQAGKAMSFTIEEAVKLGLQNSIDLKQVTNAIEISAVTDDRSRYLSRKLKDGDSKLDKAKSQVPDLQKTLDYLEQQKKQLEAAPDNYPQKQEKLKEIDGNIQKIQSGLDQIQKGDSALQDSLEKAGVIFSDKLNIDDIGALSVGSASDLMSTMSSVQYNVTKDSYDIYKNQIALLIQKNYYDALKAQKLLDVKKKAMERGEKQYQFAKDSFEHGMKAKDDMLLANTYYKGTQIEYQKAQGDYNNALIELKKSLSIPMDSQVELKDVLADQVEQQDLQNGLNSGMQNRLEMKKALGEVVVYDLNFESIKQKYPEVTYQYKEANLQKEKAKLSFEKTKRDVESSIRQSYETIKSTGEMLNTSKEMVAQARESLEIAEYKYKEGFGAENSLLKKLDLEASAGTIVEVLAAEENLAQVEEKVVEIMYGYNLARMKYMNDTGKFTY